VTLGPDAGCGEFAVEADIDAPDSGTAVTAAVKDIPAMVPVLGGRLHLLTAEVSELGIS